MTLRKTSQYHDNGESPPQVSMDKKKDKAAEILAVLKKQKPGILPVISGEHAVATSWWGKTWNKNLVSEYYATVRVVKVK